MILKLGKLTGAALLDPCNLKALSLELADEGGLSADAASVSALLGPLGRMESEGHVWIQVAGLKALGPADAAWRGDFDRMIAYAETKGWVRGTPPEVRVHLSQPENH